ncbi:MAG: hypothetical protein LBE06_03810 [Azoarcus sp.]|jgi:hypothetical protein|nr:hypothetical protein [Azoarcus sp.]
MLNSAPGGLCIHRGSITAPRGGGAAISASFPLPFFLRDGIRVTPSCVPAWPDVRQRFRQFDQPDPFGAVAIFVAPALLFWLATLKSAASARLRGAMKPDSPCRAAIARIRPPPPKAKFVVGILEWFQRGAENRASVPFPLSLRAAAMLFPVPSCMLFSSADDFKTADACF